MTFDPNSENAITQKILTRLDEIERARSERERAAEDYRTDVRKSLDALTQSVIELKLWRENLLGKVVGASIVISAIFALVSVWLEKH